jgi:sugar/nucleoside kinase (ribokinase family)
MAKGVCCIGDLLVEIMRQNVGDPLDKPGVFVGPFPSGASGIFIDAIARLGIPARFVGSVGRDDFGTLILERLSRDGVDTSRIKQLDEYTTGVAFVTYFEDGSRKFIYHLARAATGQIYPDDVDRACLEGIAYLHVVGSTMFINRQSAEACTQAARIVREQGGRVSFDPNFRPELLTEKMMQELFGPLLRQAHVVFPTEQELEVLTGIQAVSEDEEKRAEACAQLLDQGPQIVAVKQGGEGSSVYTREGSFHAPPFQVEEVDPTGAGDCYCAGFLAGLLNEMDVHQAAQLANAVGALAVTRKGPMEGAPFWSEVMKFLGWPTD